MDPITAAIAAGASAIAAGATAGLTKVAGQAVQDAYGRLKAAISARYPQATPSLQALEARPNSEAKQTSLAEDLAAVGGERDAELLQLAEALLEAIQREAPEAIRQAGVDLRKLRVERTVRIKKAQGGDVGVHGEDWEVKGDLLIDEARGGGEPDPKR